MTNDTVTIAIPLDAERVAGQLYETWSPGRDWRDVRGRVRENWLRVGEFVCRLATRVVDRTELIKQVQKRWQAKAVETEVPQLSAECFWMTLLTVVAQEAGLEVRTNDQTEDAG